ncbi:RsfA family transcriptional regulator [Virgibacillus indicus]|uniref:RsfA family transcriptional regulator n=1 Tax=Virgibacillus indicus TaxID=2024554 RepID=A0A265NG18_9BACI|nr:RsfA family transcriptional regulator [Virgibacillus indicus]OZU90419.1 RsfA family transcriptional regulator [Virgibacillus indicus]
MNATRQDAWTKDEDILLAETVLRHIRQGKTQLEAFKEVAKQLSRTSAACGFRWNATIRKNYHEAVQHAKEERKQGTKKEIWRFDNPENQDKNTIDTAILLLEKMKSGYPEENALHQEHTELVEKLEKENEQLKQQLLRYDNAWEEIGKLWGWVKNGPND